MRIVLTDNEISSNAKPPPLDEEMAQSCQISSIFATHNTLNHGQNIRNFAEDMEQKGLTKKQFQIQMVSMALYTLLAVYWIVSGAHSGDTFQWILGAVYLAFIIAYSVYLIIHYKRHPVEDPELDRKAVENFKTGTKGMALVLAIIAIGFMIAFGLAALLK